MPDASHSQLVQAFSAGLALGVVLVVAFTACWLGTRPPVKPPRTGHPAPAKPPDVPLESLGVTTLPAQSEVVTKIGSAPAKKTSAKNTPARKRRR